MTLFIVLVVTIIPNPLFLKEEGAPCGDGQIPSNFIVNDSLRRTINFTSSRQLSGGGIGVGFAHTYRGAALHEPLEYSILLYRNQGTE